jgi:hypothetical protein
MGLSTHQLFGRYLGRRDNRRREVSVMKSEDEIRLELDLTGQAMAAAGVSGDRSNVAHRAGQLEALGWVLRDGDSGHLADAGGATQDVELPRWVREALPYWMREALRRSGIPDA